MRALIKLTLLVSRALRRRGRTATTAADKLRRAMSPLPTAACRVAVAYKAVGLELKQGDRHFSLLSYYAKRAQAAPARAKVAGDLARSCGLLARSCGSLAERARELAFFCEELEALCCRAGATDTLSPPSPQEAISGQLRSALVAEVTAAEAELAALDAQDIRTRTHNDRVRAQHLRRYVPRLQRLMAALWLWE